MPEIHRQNLVRRPVFSLVRLLVGPSPYRVAPATGESIGAHICHIPSTLAMSSHATSCSPIPPWSSCQYRNTPSTNQLHVFAFQVGRSVWLHKRYCLKTFSNFFRQGGNVRNLFDFDNQSARFFCVDTIKYYPIANVPSGLEGVKLRSHRQTIRTHPKIPTQPRLKVSALTRIA